jgi:lantibiotic biosynthesis protein
MVQLSGPPLDVRLTAVARVPELFPVLPLGDFQPAPQWTVDDLAVTGDGQRLWLVSQTTGQPVELLSPCGRFDWGYASGLPFLPRVRHGRSILHPARWIIVRTALSARSAGWSQWRDAWQREREQHRRPQMVLVGDDVVRLRLDLDDDAHLAVLRSQIDRHAETLITEAPGRSRWIGGVMAGVRPSPPPRQCLLPIPRPRCAG